MTYELIQDLLTDGAIATLLTALALPVLHAFTRSTAIATHDQPVTPAYEPEPVTPVDVEPETEAAIAPLHPPTPYLVVSPVEPARAWDGLTVPQLRVEFDRRGIKWNRAGKGGKHLTKPEMIRALEGVAIQAA